ncbi:hypothetical protein LCGC14_1562800 [marine sediment metagenome]|uniref:Uncharacterized protein n=1 Tax=marine sediment metagenome TaxID=412755 RepID=A0A0F9L3D8_9ZZZZ
MELKEAIEKIEEIGDKDPSKKAVIHEVVDILEEVVED